MGEHHDDPASVRGPWWDTTLFWALLAAAAVLLAALWLAPSARGSSQVCRDELRNVEHMWTRQVRIDLARAEIGKPTIERLEDWFDRWREERRETCHAREAGALRRQQAAARRQCLDQAAESWRALLRLSTKDQRWDDERVSTVLGTLTRPQACRSVDERGLQPLPVRPERLAEVLVARHELALARLWLAVGEAEVASAELSAPRERLERIGFEPLLVRVELAQLVAGGSGAIPSAGLVRRAERIGDDVAVARLLVLQRLRGGALDPVAGAWLRGKVERASDPLATASLRCLDPSIESAPAAEPKQAGEDGQRPDRCGDALAELLGPTHVLTRELAAFDGDHSIGGAASTRVWQPEQVPKNSP